MKRKLFTYPTVLLTLVGLALNVLFVYLTDVFSIPLYLDSIGTVIAAALGGALPGIAVGFLSNCLTAFLSVSPDPMTLYYGFLNVLIALAAAWFSKTGLLRKWYGAAAAVFAFSFIGGALGSVVTWALYGFSFGQGISAPLAGLYFRDLMLGEFTAQFAADMTIDLIDKLLTVIILQAVLTFLPDSAMEKLPLGEIYRDRRKPVSPAALRARSRGQIIEELTYRKRSINTKITLLIIISSVILSAVALTIGIRTYKDKLIMQYTAVCGDAVNMMLAKIDGDRVADYLLEGEAAQGYAETKEDLYDILNNMGQLKFMYVYAIRPDGCHVVFDLDAPELVGEKTGNVIPFDQSFPYPEQVLAGEEIPPFVTNDTYGWLLTVYRPIRDSSGAVAAYAAADIDMESISTNLYSYCISIISLLFGVLIVITTFSLWYCDKKLLDPIGILMRRARGFDWNGAHTGEKNGDPPVTTGDELEELYGIMCRTERAFAGHVREIEQKNLEISRMQRNIIYTLANMVENRDGNTGGHIKRTAAYVRLIGQLLREKGICGGAVDDRYIKMLYDSAPLHDIGKIKIPDAILNKPGKLTPEEFDQMKTHTTQGREILETSLSEIEDGMWLSMAIDMAACHHEKWDGTGYPRGLSGEEIPLSARIMAVSDVFDALVTVRSYKPAFSFDEAMEIIGNGAGAHFDPNIARVFCGAGDQIQEIMKER